MAAPRCRLGILDGYPVRRGRLADYPMRGCFEPLLGSGVAINLLVPDDQDPRGGEEYEEDGFRIFTTSLYRHPLDLGQFARHPVRGLLDPIARFVGASNTILLRVPSPLAPVLHLAASARGRRIVPFFMGDWAGGLANRSGAGTAALKIANLPWQLYHRSLLTYRNVLSTGPHMGHPTVRLVAFFPQLAGSNRPAPLRSRQKPPGEIRLLSIGRLTLAKGVDLLIRSLSALPDRFVLTVAGDGPERMALQELARHANVASRVTFAGHLGRSALRDLYDTNDVLVIPSRTEGIPKVLLEGIAAGIRIVAPAVGGIPHVPAISDFAQLFAPGNIQSLTAAIRLAADAASGPQRREALQAWPACLTSLDATAVIQALL